MSREMSIVWKLQVFISSSLERLPHLATFFSIKKLDQEIKFLVLIKYVHNMDNKINIETLYYGNNSKIYVIYFTMINHELFH